MSLNIQSIYISMADFVDGLPAKLLVCPHVLSLFLPPTSARCIMLHVQCQNLHISQPRNSPVVRDEQKKRSSSALYVPGSDQVHLFDYSMDSSSLFANIIGLTCACQTRRKRVASPNGSASALKKEKKRVDHPDGNFLVAYTEFDFIAYTRMKAASVVNQR